MGTVIHVTADSAVVLCGHVGYRIFPVGCLVEMNADVRVWIYDVVREDRRDLYGFLDLETKNLFEQLIDIDGVGHKLAQKILNSVSSESLREHIVRGDIVFLTSLSGVGKKTAQKIILEMKGVLVEDVSGSGGGVSQEVMDGLRSLGYSLKDVQGYLEDLPDDTEKALKEVLRRIANTM